MLTFELVNNPGQSLFLIFGTTHQRGLENMKEAMWAVDPVHGVQYRDPADPNQQLLDIQPEPVTAPLQRELLHYLGLADHHSATVAELRDYAFFKTVYKRSQVKPVLAELAAKGGWQVRSSPFPTTQCFEIRAMPYLHHRVQLAKWRSDDC